MSKVSQIVDSSSGEPDEEQARDRHEADLKEGLREVQSKVSSLTDPELEVETRYLGMRIETLRADIDDYKRGNTPRVVSWLRRASYAVANLEAEWRFHTAEQDRRRDKLRAERAQALAAEQQRAKLARIEAEAAHRLERSQLFVDHARKMIPRETWTAIWAAVDADWEAKP